MTKTHIFQGDVFQVSISSNGNNENRSIIATSGGGYIVTWLSLEDLGGSLGLETPYLVGQKFDPYGNKVGSEAILTEGMLPYSDRRNIEITELENGNILVLTYRNLGDPDNDVVFAQLFNSDLEAIGIEIMITELPFFSGYLTDLTSLSDGSFIVVLSYKTTIDGQYNLNVFGQKYSENGVKEGLEFQINSYTGNNQTGGKITEIEGGGFVVTWDSYEQDGQYGGVYSQLFDKSGVKIGQETIVNTTTTGNEFYPEITKLSNGGYVVIWQTITDINSTYAQVFGSDGQKIGVEIHVKNLAQDAILSPEVIGMKDGGFIVLFDIAPDLTGDSPPDDIWKIGGKRYDHLGETVGEEFLVARVVTEKSVQSSVTVLENGGYVVTWKSTIDDYRDDEIFAQHFAPQLFGTAGNDTVIDNVGANWIDGQGGDDVLKGKSGKDTIRGGEGADQLYGQNGRDFLLGGSGDDTLYGGSQSDQLNGGSGKDHLIGGNGRDYLKGGIGADVFVYVTEKHSGRSKGADHILDFQIGVDKLDLTAFDLGFGFVSDGEFTGEGPEIGIGVNGSGHTIVRVDLDGDARFDMKIVLDHTSVLTSEDFLI